MKKLSPWCVHLPDELFPNSFCSCVSIHSRWDVRMHPSSSRKCNLHSSRWWNVRPVIPCPHCLSRFLPQNFSSTGIKIPFKWLALVNTQRWRNVCASRFCEISLKSVLNWEISKFSFTENSSDSKSLFVCVPVYVLIAIVRILCIRTTYKSRFGIVRKNVPSLPGNKVNFEWEKKDFSVDL